MVRCEILKLKLLRAIFGFKFGADFVGGGGCTGGGAEEFEAVGDSAGGQRHLRAVSVTNMCSMQ